MELERSRPEQGAERGEAETVLVGVGLGPSDWRALRAFEGEVETATRTRWIEAPTVDGACSRVRLLGERGVSCIGLVRATLGEREVVRFVRSLQRGRGLSPAVVLGGRGDEAVIAAAMAASACDFVWLHELDADCLVRAFRLAAEVAAHAREAELWELATADADERFAAVWELQDDGLLWVDEQRIVRRSNRAAQTLLGLAPAELHGTPFGALRWTQAEAPHVDPAVVGATELPAEIERPDGSRVQVGMRVRPFSQRSGGAPVRMRVVLLRERRETPEHAALLAEARQFAGLGRLLAGAAHDGNNLLTPLLGYCDLLLAALPPGSDLERYALEIERSARRMSHLLHGLLERSRGNPEEVQRIPADAALAEVSGLLRSLVGRSVELSEQFAAPDAAIALRSGQLEQIVLNLVANARDAMPGGGKLALRTTLEADRVWALEIEDSGMGIPPEHLDRLFDPKFTTKQAGKGTGLGLWIVRSIVQEGGGRIRVRSQAGRGTIVRIEFPVAAGAAAHAPFLAEEPGR